MRRALPAIAFLAACGGSPSTPGGAADLSGAVTADLSGAVTADLSIADLAPAANDAGPDLGGPDLGRAPSCDNYCSSVMANCLGNDQQYPTLDQCTTECAALPPGRYGDANDSVGCREAAAVQAAASPAQSCLRAGPTGGGGCGARCDAYCTLLFAVCVAANRGATNPYATPADCAAACARMRFDANAPELDGTNHDTLNCRQYYLQQAWSDFGGGSALFNCPFLAPSSTVCNL